MKIALGADHAGFELKERVVAFLRSLGHDAIDLGTVGPNELSVPGSIDWLAASLAVFALFAVFRLKIGMGMALGGSAVLGVGLWLIGLI